MICGIIAISKSHYIVFMDNLWYNCDKQEYHNFALYKRLFIGDLWHMYGQYECQGIVPREISDHSKRHSYIPFLQETSGDDKIYIHSMF